MRDYIKSKKTLIFFIVFLPVLTFSAGWAVSRLDGAMARANPTVRLAERVYLENTGKVDRTTDASTAFRATGKTIEQLYSEASNIRAEFALGGWAVGAFFGLVVGLKLIRLCIRWQRTDYLPDRAGCLACGRCFEYCPREHLRLKKIKEATVEK